jgi:hypothetical protein
MVTYSLLPGEDTRDEKVLWFNSEDNPKIINKMYISTILIIQFFFAKIIAKHNLKNNYLSIYWACLGTQINEKVMVSFQTALRRSGFNSLRSKNN